MCGIFGCVQRSDQVAKVIYQALKRLEYRGYDSAGIATLHEGVIFVKKDQGKLDHIHARLNLEDLPGRVGIGHTRWATHGAPLQVNAHPHIDCSHRIAAVHNGIIENFVELKKELEGSGHIFVSKTDSEVIPHLIEDKIKAGLKFPVAVREAAKRLEGSYSAAVIYEGEQDGIVCLREKNPLLIGVGSEGLYVASDIPAILPFTNRIVDVMDGELVVISDTGYEIRKIEDWSIVERKPKIIDWSIETAQKGGFPHYMLKEIHEQARSLRNALLLQDRYLDLIATFLDRSKQIFLLASGTSYHACLAASYMFSKFACVAAYPVVGSELIQQYGDSIHIDSTILAVSQSGETADILQAAEYARLRAATVLGLTNVIGSTLTRISRAYICQQSGPEIGVAATKTFTAQLIVLAQLALRLAKLRGKISQDEIDEFNVRLKETPNLVELVIKREEGKIKLLAKKYRESPIFYFLGRGISSATALEGRLKLLEVARVPALSYPAGESKHGPISLVEPGFPIIFIVPRDETRKMALSNMMEMKARGGVIIPVAEEGDEEVLGYGEDHIEVPKGAPEILSPILYVVPLQLFAYYMAVERGYDPDKPCNLAKCVTVL
ncbi:MAG: glutamine--fructose-6-phosphate transaminase (isomerizing) [Candidatus Bathyarchaeia archaeon]